MISTEKDVIIIGAGLTGLALGVFLKEKGLTFSIIEKNENTGGVIGTRDNNGFIYETGPNTGVLSTPELIRLFDILGDKAELETADKSASKRYIWKNGKWRAMPSGLFSAVGTPLFSLYDKFRILGEPFRKPGNNPDESVADLVRRRMGKSFLNYAVDPFISGVYAGNPDKLITRYALPKLYNLEQNYGSFIGGAMKKAKEPKTELEKRATREVFSVKGGLGNLIKGMVDYIGSDHIFTSCSETSINATKDIYTCTFNKNDEKKKFTAGKVVTTTGSGDLNKLLPFTNSSDIQRITGLNHARIVLAAVGYNKWEGVPLDAFGGLIPSKEERKVLGVLFPSAIFSGRAPEGGAQLSVFMGGYRDGRIIDKSDAEIKNIVMDEMKSMMGTGNRIPEVLDIFRYEKAIPQYELSSGDRFAAINKIQDQYPGLYIAGNIRDGIGMADRVKQAGQLAESIGIME
ncbi:MAG: protoporphyrinogen oxidase [Bacteroidales bacterium]|nr:protoporphyrinogen oxidase [Bacteroidales bacterium]